LSILQAEFSLTQTRLPEFVGIFRGRAEQMRW
jgi:hypothetical protein